MTMENVKNWILAGLVFALISSCTDNKKTNKDLESFMNKKIAIPYESMDVRFCSFFSDSLSSNDDIRIIVVFSDSGCSGCKIKEYSIIEQICIEKYNHANITYIVPCPKAESKNIFTMFCNSRIEGVVCIDTCNAFLHANPHFPDNELFHTFVINNEGKVLMVGNPFQNEKMEALFKKVIANEQKKQKKKRPA